MRNNNSNELILQFLRIYRSQKIFFGGVFLAVFLSSVLIAVFWPPIYEAEGSVLVLGKGSKDNLGKLQQTQSEDPKLSKEEFRLEAEILQSPELLVQAVEHFFSFSTLEKKDIPTSRGGYFITDFSPYDIEENFERLQGGLKVQLIPSFRIIKVALQDKDPQWAESILDILLEQYLSYRANVHESTDAEGFSSKRAESYGENIDNIEKRFLSQAQRTASSLPGVELQKNIELRIESMQELREIQDKYFQLALEKEQLTNATEEDKLQLGANLNNNIIREFEKILAQFTVKRAELLEAYSQESEIVLLVEKNLQETKEALRKEIQHYQNGLNNELNILLARKKHLQDIITKVEKRSIELQAALVKEHQTKRETDLIEFSDNTISQRNEESKITPAIPTEKLFSDVTILSRPGLTAKVVFPQKKSVLAIGFFSGLLAGFSLAFIRDSLTRSAKVPTIEKEYYGNMNVGSRVEVDESPYRELARDKTIDTKIPVEEEKNEKRNFPLDSEVKGSTEIPSRIPGEQSECSLFEKLPGLLIAGLDSNGTTRTDDVLENDTYYDANNNPEQVSEPRNNIGELLEESFSTSEDTSEMIYFISDDEYSNSCPACGFFTLKTKGEGEYCKICNWQDDDSSRENPRNIKWVDGKPNGQCLMLVQQESLKRWSLEVDELEGFQRDLNWAPYSLRKTEIKNENEAFVNSIDHRQQCEPNNLLSLRYVGRNDNGETVYGLKNQIELWREENISFVK